VIIAGDGPDSSFLSGTEDAAMAIPPMPEAVESIASIVRAAESRVWLVSKCGPRIQARTRLWLKRWRFFEGTGLPAENLRFCLKRPEKADHARALSLTHFIDDRLDVIDALRGVVANLILFGPQRQAFEAASGFAHARDWAAVRELVCIKG
jgi:hypothetical protein